MFKLQYIMRVAMMVAVFVCTLTAAAKDDVPMTSEERQKIRKELLSQLPKIKNPHKRVVTAYNILDLSNHKQRLEGGELLYEEAKAAGDTAAIYDALRQIANTGDKNDSLMLAQIARAQSMPESDMRSETITFIYENMASHAAREKNDSARIEAFRVALDKFSDNSRMDYYGRIEMLSTICAFLTHRPSSTLLTDYLEQLGRLIDQLPDSYSPLRNKYYNTKAVSSTLVGHAQEALEADSVLMEIMDSLDVRNRRLGRKYISYDVHRYQSLRRMLVNKAIAGLGDVQPEYDAILEIAERNPDVRGDLQRRSLIEACVLYAHGNYEAAVPMLQKAVSNPSNSQYKFILLQALSDAAEKTGNDAAALLAYRELTSLLRQGGGENDPERVIELRFMHDIDNLRHSNDNLSAQNKNLEREADQRRHIYMIGIAAALLILSVGFYVAYRRQATTASRMRKLAEALKIERDNLEVVGEQLTKARDDARIAERKQNDFINTVSHEIEEPVNAIVGYTQLIIDAMDEEHRMVLERFVNIINSNAQMVKMLVNDVLDVAELEESKVVLKSSRVTLESLVQYAAEPLMHRLQPGVTFEVEPMEGSDSETKIFTDTARTEQVLSNLISNAFKFTAEGRITVRYGLDSERKIAKFVVEDTGPGIPEDRHESIFGRFEKLGHYNQGIGLGLYICRMVAELLNGRVYIDSSYKGGTRFVFEIPTDVRTGPTSITTA